MACAGISYGEGALRACASSPRAPSFSLNPLACLRVRAAVERKGLSVHVSLADMQCEREISNFQAQPRAVFQRMRGKATKRSIPTDICVFIVRLRRDIDPRGPREPLYRIVGLQAGPAQPALVNAAKWRPIRITHDHHSSSFSTTASRSCYSYLIAADVPGASGRGSTSTMPCAMRTR